MFGVDYRPMHVVRKDDRRAEYGNVPVMFPATSAAHGARTGLYLWLSPSSLHHLRGDEADLVPSFESMLESRDCRRVQPLSTEDLAKAKRLRLLREQQQQQQQQAALAHKQAGGMPAGGAMLGMQGGGMPGAMPAQVSIY